ncbi:MAG TPA: hypothetical protein DCX19_06285 [Alphaproteobacteria bacterium]|nr:hypothetical protein [Alphaproteobacteria bacterium]
MPQYNWNEIPDDQIEVLIKKINALSTFDMFTPGRSHLTIAELPFYSEFKLLQATTFSSIPPVTMEYLIKGEGENAEVIKMDGTREPIFENNPKGGLILNKDTVVAYAAFVLDAVQTEQGSLRLVEKVDEDTFTDTPTPQQRKDVTHMIRPAKVTETGDGFALDAIMLYGDSVYRADIDVKKDGFIEIKDEQLLAEGLPIRPIFLE